MDMGELGCAIGTSLSGHRGPTHKYTLQDAGMPARCQNAQAEPEAEIRPASVSVLPGVGRDARVGCEYKGDDGGFIMVSGDSLALPTCFA